MSKGRTTTRTNSSDDQGWFNSLDGPTDATFTFDPDGGLLTQDMAATTAGDLSFGYDAWGGTSSATYGTTGVSFALDALGRTTKRTDGSEVTDLVYVGGSEELATMKTGSQITTFTSTPGGAYATRVGTAGTVQLYLRDLHGDAVARIAKAGTSLSSKTWYSPFGESTPLLAGTAPTSGLALGFQSQLTDPDTTTVDMTTRLYLPGLGRFTTRDVLQGDPANPPSLNLFVYVGGSPVGNTDTSGLTCPITSDACSTQGPGGTPNPGPGPAQGGVTEGSSDTDEAPVATGDSGGSVDCSVISVLFCAKPQPPDVPLISEFFYKAFVEHWYLCLTGQDLSGEECPRALVDLATLEASAIFRSFFAVTDDAAIAASGADDVVDAGRSLVGRELALSGRAAEEAVATRIGIPRNVGPGAERIPFGSGRGGFRQPDFAPTLTIPSRGTIVEVKDTLRLTSSAQLRDLVRYAEQQGVPLEIFTNAKLPSRGELAQWIDRGRVIISPL